MKFKTSTYLLLTMSILFLVGCGSSVDDQKIEVEKYVKVQTVSDNQSGQKLSFTCFVKEKSLTSLSFRVSGPIKELKVKSGDYIKQNDLIAVIDKRDYEIQLQSAKAQYEQAISEYERYKILYDKNKIPANTFEKFQSAYLMTKSAYENALNQLEDTDLKAPFSGYVHEKFIENFQTVGAGQPIISLIDLSQLEIIVSVPENQLLSIKKEKEAFLNIKNAGIEMHPVKILSISEKVMKDGMYEVKFVMINSNGFDVFPGMTAEIIVCLGANEATVSIASSALFTRDNSTYVWVFDAKTEVVHKRKVEVKRALPEGVVEIKSGLRSGEIVVTAGVHSLDENQKVKPLKKSKTNVGGLL